VLLRPAAAEELFAAPEGEGARLSGLVLVVAEAGSVEGPVALEQLLTVNESRRRRPEAVSERRLMYRTSPYSPRYDLFLIYQCTNRALQLTAAQRPASSQSNKRQGRAR
jgi:hypothetical protein